MKLHPVPVLGALLIIASFAVGGRTGAVIALAGAALCFGYLRRTRGGAR